MTLLPHLPPLPSLNRYDPTESHRPRSTPHPSRSPFRVPQSPSPYRASHQSPFRTPQSTLATSTHQTSAQSPQSTPNKPTNRNPLLALESLASIMVQSVEVPFFYHNRYVQVNP